MNSSTQTVAPSAVNSSLLLAGAQRAARLASSIAEVATQWAESAHAGLDAARDARDSAVLARLVVENASPTQTDDAIRVLAADAWEAVQRAIDATQRVSRAVSAMYH